MMDTTNAAATASPSPSPVDCWNIIDRSVLCLLLSPLPAADLARTRSCSQLWHRAASHSSAWQFTSGIESAIVHLSRAGNLGQLDSLFRSIPHLRTLDVQCIDIDRYGEKGLKGIVKSQQLVAELCTSLHTLRTSIRYWKTKADTHSTALGTLAKMRSLETLDLLFDHRHRKEDTVTLQGIISHLPDTSITSNGIGKRISVLILRETGGAVSFQQSSWRTSNVAAKEIVAILPQLPLLQTLDVTYMENGNASLLPALRRCCPELRWLALNSLHAIDAGGFEDDDVQLPSLSSSEAHLANPSHAVALEARVTPALDCLRQLDTLHLTTFDAAFAIPMLCQCTNLTALSLNNIAGSISLEPLSAIPGLQYLGLHFDEQSLSVSFTSIKSGCSPSRRRRHIAAILCSLDTCSSLTSLYLPQAASEQPEGSTSLIPPPIVEAWRTYTDYIRRCDSSECDDADDANCENKVASTNEDSEESDDANEDSEESDDADELNDSGDGSGEFLSSTSREAFFRVCQNAILQYREADEKELPRRNLLRARKAELEEMLQSPNALGASLHRLRAEYTNIEVDADDDSLDGDWEPNEDEDEDDEDDEEDEDEDEQDDDDEDSPWRN